MTSSVSTYDWSFTTLGSSPYIKFSMYASIKLSPYYSMKSQSSCLLCYYSSESDYSSNMVERSCIISRSKNMECAFADLS